MNSSLSETKTDAIGLLVLEEFASFQAVKFIELIGRSKEYIPNQTLRWRDSKAGPAEGFNSHYGQCDLIVKGRSIDLHLFDLPMSLLPNFNLNDLVFPVEIRGCLLLVNQEIDPSMWKKERFPGWYGWIQAQKITILVAVTGADASALPLNEFLDYLNLGPETQVMKLSSHHATDRTRHHVFEMAEAKHLLTTLAENILTNTVQPSD
jgi:hypothetical protein